MRSSGLTTLALLPSLAFAGEPQNRASIPSVVTVEETEANVPANPPRPDMKLNLPNYNLSSWQFTFPSGLRVLFQPDATEPVVAVTSYIDRGSTSDPIGKEGIAHFVEHLWFRSEHEELRAKGSDKSPKVWDILAELGAGDSLNASTADDWTNYMTVAPASAISTLMKLESLRLTEAVEGVKEGVVQIEREVIRNELRMRYENTFLSAFPYMMDRLYPVGHPYQRLGIGTHGSLNNITLADIQQFVKDNYKPENTTLVVVGDIPNPDVNPRAQEEFLDLLFENMAPHLIDPKLSEKNRKVFRAPNLPADVKFDPENPAHTITRFVLNPDEKDPNKYQFWQWDNNAKIPTRVPQDKPAPEPPVPPNQKYETFKANVEEPTVIVAWNLPGGYRGNDRTLDVLMGVAGNVLRGHFWDRKDVKSADCGAWASKESTKGFCLVEIDKASEGERVAEEVIDQMNVLWDPEVMQALESSLVRARMDILTDLLLSVDVVSDIGSGRATTIAQHWHYTGSPKAHTDQMNAVFNTSGEKVRELADKYLRRDKAIRILIEPLAEEEMVLDSSDAAYHGATKDDGVVSPLTPVSAITSEFVATQTAAPDFTTTRETTLRNGLRVVVMPHGQAPVVQAGLVFSAADTDGKLILAQQLADSTWDDAPGNPSDPLAIAGRWVGNSGDTTDWEAIVASSGNLDGALFLLREAEDKRKLELGEKAGWVKRQRDSIKSSWKDREWWSRQARYGIVNPGHTHWASISWEQLDALEDASGSDLTAFAQSVYRPDNATLVIVGNVDPDKALSQARTYFAGWKNPAVEATKDTTLPPPNTPLQGKVIVLDDSKSTQTNISAICALRPHSPETRAHYELVGDVLDKRAWTALRETSGATYGAGGRTVLIDGGSAYLFLSSLVQNDATDLAVSTFQRLAKDAESGRFDETAFAVHKLQLARKYGIYQQSTDQMFDRLVRNLGEPWENLLGYGSQLAGTRMSDMQAAMGTCSSNMVVTVEGPKQVVTAELDEAGIPYEVFDWKTKGDEMLLKYDPKAYKALMKERAKEEAKKAKK